MYTDPEDLRSHLKRMRREARYERLMGDPDRRLRWLTIYIRVLEIRLDRAARTRAA